MWIRSQDRREIVNVDCLRISPIDKKFKDIDGKIGAYVEDENGRYAIISNINLGEYSSKEKALKVLDMIQKAIEHTDMLKIDEKGKFEQVHISVVFAMPKDEEV